MPIAGTFAARVADAEQTVWSGPAFDALGGAFRIIDTVSRVVAHTPFAIIHSNKLAPTLSPVTPEVGSFGNVTEAPPANTVQVPVPTPGVFPASAALVEQTD